MQHIVDVIREWRVLIIVGVVYYSLASVLSCYADRQCIHRRADHPRKYRVVFAVLLALVCTPGVVSDFFLFTIPAPAVLGLIVLLPAAIFQPNPFLWVLLVFYVAPMALAFSIFYLILWLRDRWHPLPPEMA